jgi:hypothetical protein
MYSFEGTYQIGDDASTSTYFVAIIMLLAASTTIFVYASGCRIALSKQSPLIPFAEAQERAWQFFENALSVHTELLYCATSLVAVQALTAMVRLLSSLKRQD